MKYFLIWPWYANSYLRVFAHYIFNSHISRLMLRYTSVFVGYPLQSNLCIRNWFRAVWRFIELQHSPIHIVDETPGPISPEDARDIFDSCIFMTYYVPRILSYLNKNMLGLLPKIIGPWSVYSTQQREMLSRLNYGSVGVNDGRTHAAIVFVYMWMYYVMVS